MNDFTNGAHECFCDRKYKDANKLASCGDCPRDYIAGAWDARRKYVGEHSKMTDRDFRGADLTIRDYFAAKAMHAIIAEPVENGAQSFLEYAKKRLGLSSEGMDACAQAAYAMADAMLKAREGEQ